MAMWNIHRVNPNPNYSYLLDFNAALRYWKHLFSELISPWFWHTFFSIDQWANISSFHRPKTYRPKIYLGKFWNISLTWLLRPFWVDFPNINYDEPGFGRTGFGRDEKKSQIYGLGTSLINRFLKCRFIGQNRSDSWMKTSQKPGWDPECQQWLSSFLGGQNST